MKKTTTIYKGSVLFEANIEANGCSYLVIYGKHVNGYFMCIPNFGFGCEMSDPADMFWNCESMINAGILDGDMVLVEETPAASNGDMVVAMVDDGATVKTFYKEEGIFRLQPENDFMDPIIVKEVTILGKVIGVFRFFK